MKNHHWNKRWLLNTKSTKLIKDKRVSCKQLPTLNICQFEWLKKDILKKIGYDPSDLNYSYFDMKEASYAEVELDLVSLPFFADEKIVILDHLLDLTTAKKRNLTDEDLKQFENYLGNPSESTRLVIFAEGKLDSKRRLVKLLKRDAQIIEATTPKEQDLKRYFSGQAQESRSIAGLQRRWSDYPPRYRGGCSKVLAR